MNQNMMMAGVRIILILGTMLNSVLAHYGMNPIPLSSDFVYQTISDILLLGAVLYGWKKNNDITAEGVAGTAVTKNMKNKPLNPDEQKALQEAKGDLNSAPVTDAQVDDSIIGTHYRKDDFNE